MKGSLFACVLLVLVQLAPVQAEEKPSPESRSIGAVGQSAPPIETVDLSGEPFSLQALKGRPVLIDFGSVLCDACVKMVGEMNRLRKKYAGTDLAIVMIADGSMPEEMTRSFFTRLEASFPVVRDEDWRIFDAYGVTVVPFKVLIDRTGTVRSKHLGFDTPLEKILPIEAVLK